MINRKHLSEINEMQACFPKRVKKELTKTLCLLNSFKPKAEIYARIIEIFDLNGLYYYK